MNCLEYHVLVVKYRVLLFNARQMVGGKACNVTVVGCLLLVIMKVKARKNSNQWIESIVFNKECLKTVLGIMIRCQRVPPSSNSVA